MTRNTATATGGQHGSRPDKHVSDYLRALYKRRWIAGPVFLVVFAVTAVNTLRQTPVYQSRAQLLIETDTPTVAKLDQIFDSSGYENDAFYQTQYRILQSRSLAKLTIDRMKLWDAPRLGNGPEPKATIDIIGLPSMALRSVARLAKGIVSSPDPVPAQAPSAEDDAARSKETARQSARIDQFLAGLAIVPVRNSKLVEVRYSSTDPKFAADAANALSQAYMQQNMEYKFSTSKDAADWLGERLAEQRAALEQSEAALQSYKERNGTVSVTDSASNIVVQRLGDLNTALTKAKTERISKEALYNQLKSAEGTGTLDTFPSVVANDYIQKLRADLSDMQRQQATLAQRYGDRNPELIKLRTTIEGAEAKLKVELSKVVESVRNEYEAALMEERSLQASLDAQKTEALSLNRKGIEYGVLQREVESNKQIYESLMQRTKETGISSELRANNVRVMDAAEIPRSPVSPNIQRELSVWFGASFLLAIGLAFGLEFLDNRIRTPENIRHDLGLPFLGMVPALTEKAMQGAPPLLHGDVPVNFAEAIRSVRTSLLFSSADDGAKTLVVTSTAPGEGKTLVAANIAIALAQAGQRVILMDADMRRPRVHEVFSIDQDPGLSNLVVGRVDRSNAIRSSEVSGLSLLAAGHIPPNPSELLVSKKFQSLIAEMKSEYDWIILDSPPVMAVTDACLLAHDATGVLFVIGSEMIDRNAASAALDQLEASNAHFVGAVLNKVNLDRHHYYYSHYYRRDYVKHYARPAQS
jgi:capsular exopolysaccharide synthesis family protein